MDRDSLFSYVQSEGTVAYEMVEVNNCRVSLGGLFFCCLCDEYRNEGNKYVIVCSRW